MRTSYASICVATAICLLSLYTRDAVATPFELTPDNFEREVYESGKNSLVMFYAPWCGHCKRLRPGFDKVADQYTGSTTVLIGDVDCTEHQQLCEDNDVQGYPSLRYYFTGDKRPQHYAAPREYEEMLKWTIHNLEQKCAMTNLRDCTDQEQAYASLIKKKDAAWRKAQIARLGKLMNARMSAMGKRWVLVRENMLRQLEEQ